jgi:hypothetical protein
MLACGSFTMPFIEFEFGGGASASALQEPPLSPLSPLPAPAMNIDKSSFNELPIEERLEQTKNHLQHLKETLLKKENDYEDQQQELKFYIIKNEELMDVVNTFRCPSETKSYELMKLKSTQNSELTLQVHSLRDLLNKSGNEIASLQKQIQSLNYKIDSLSNVKGKNQRLQTQLNGLVKIVNNVDVTISSSSDIVVVVDNDDDDDGTIPSSESESSEWISIQWMNNMIPKSVSNNNAAGVDEDEGASESEGENTKSIQMITRKVITMEADRQRLLKESLLVNQNRDRISKVDQIASLERKVRSMQYEQDNLQETNSALRRQMCVREGKISALEQLFQNINANRSIDGTTRKNKKKTHRKVPSDSQYRIERSVSLINGEESDDDDDDDYCDEDIDINSVTSGNDGIQQSFEEIFTSIWTTFSSPVENKAQNLIVGSGSGSGSNGPSSGRSMEEEGEELEYEDMDGINTDDSSCHDEMSSSCGAFSVTGDSYHTKQVEEELQAAAQKEYDELHSHHNKLCEDYESSQLRIADLTAKLEESIMKATSFEKKSELREGLLKDVIQQYKELQLENSTSKDQLRIVKQKVTVLIQLEKERAAEVAAVAAAAAAVTATEGQQKVGLVSKKEGNNNNNGEFLEEETPTFDMSSDGSSTGSNNDNHNEDENKDENENENEDEDEDDGSTSSSSSSLYTTDGLDKKFMTEDYKRLESECDRLQHEFDAAINKITSLEEQLEENKVQVHENLKVSTEKSHKIALLEKEKFILQERIIEVTNKIVDVQQQSTHSRQSIEVDTELKLAEQKLCEARTKQMDREQDLWDVIEQYKELAETNDTTTKEKTEIEHELFLTQRRDLGYEHCKLEKGRLRKERKEKKRKKKRCCVVVRF